MTDDYLKDWLNSKFASLEKEIAETKEIAIQNHNTLYKYLWFWRGMRALGMIVLAIITANWGEVSRLFQKHIF